MTAKRPKSLKWVGAMLPDGRPERYLEFLTPTDIDEARTDELTQDQLSIVRNSELYREVHAVTKTAKPATSRPHAPTATEEPESASEPDIAAETATES